MKKKKLNKAKAIEWLALIVLVGYILWGLIGLTIYRMHRYEFQTGYITGYSEECGVFMLGQKGCRVGDYIIGVKNYRVVK